MADVVRVEAYDPKIGPTDAQFKIVSWKTVKDINGVDVQVEGGVEVVTVQNLEKEKAWLLERIALIDKKLEDIGKL